MPDMVECIQPYREKHFPHLRANIQLINDISRDENLSSQDIATIENEMWDFMESYTRCWTFTDRARAVVI
jgi:hypothetical protein